MEVLLWRSRPDAVLWSRVTWCSGQRSGENVAFRERRETGRSVTSEESDKSTKTSESSRLRTSNQNCARTRSEILVPGGGTGIFPEYQQKEKKTSNCRREKVKSFCRRFAKTGEEVRWSWAEVGFLTAWWSEGSGEDLRRIRSKGRRLTHQTPAAIWPFFLRSELPSRSFNAESFTCLLVRGVL